MFYLLKGLMLLYLFSLPLSITGMEIFSWLAIVTLLVSFSTEEGRSIVDKINLKNIYLALPFGLAVILGTFVSTNFPNESRFETIGEVRWIILVFLFPMIFLRFWNYRERFFKFFMGLLAFVATYSIIQVFTGIDIFADEPYLPNSLGTLWRVKGFTGIMTYSYSISMLFLILYSALLQEWGTSKERIYLQVCTVLVGISLILTFTRGMWISLIFSMLVMTILINRKKLFQLVGSICSIGIVFFLTIEEFRKRVFLIFDLTNISTLGRFKLWIANWNIFKDNPVFGVGFLRNKTYLTEYYSRLGIEDGMVSHAHNNYLSVMAGVGIVGLISYMIFVIGFLLMGIKLWRQRGELDLFDRVVALGVLGAMINFHIGGLTECNYLDGEVMHAYVVVLSLLIVVWSRRMNKQGGIRV